MGNMNFKSLLVLLVLVPFTIFAADKAPNWVPIAESHASEEIDVYYDMNSFESTTNDSGTYASIALLYKRHEPIKIALGTTVEMTEVTSLVRWMFIDCSNGMMEPMRDFYFNDVTQLPTIGSPIVSSVMYDPKTSIGAKIKRYTKLYKVVCPDLREA